MSIEGRARSETRLLVMTLGLLLAGGTCAAQDAPAGQWAFGAMAGVMTTNDLAGLATGSVDVANSGLAGLFVSYERPLARFPRWEIGFELQANQHFGDNSLQEFVLPATIRFNPDNPWFPAIDSYAFGMGLSITDKVPAVEVETYGDSQHALIYLMAETAFDVGGPNDDVFLRVHHRSDGYGFFETDSGSNALTIGYRRGF